MKLQFNSIHIENFLSIGCADIPLNDNGYVLVSGINNSKSDSALSNGSGKSSIFDSILWALTGETIRGASSVTNINGNDGALVEIYISVDDMDYSIRRTKDHSRYKTSLQILSDGKDLSGKGIRDSEKILQNLLPDINASVLGSVVLLGQGLPMRFTNNKPSERKAMLESLSKSDYMVEDLKNRISERKEELTAELRSYEAKRIAVETEISCSEAQLDGLKRELAELPSEESLVAEVREHERELDECSEDLEKANANYMEYNSELVRLRGELLSLDANKKAKIATETSVLVEKLNALSNRKTVLQCTHKELSNKIADKKKVRDVCPTCGQKLLGVTLPNTVLEESQLMACSDELSSVQNEIVLLTSEKEKLEAKIVLSTQDRRNSIIESGSKAREESLRLKSYCEEKTKTNATLLEELAGMRERLASLSKTRAETVRKIGELSDLISEKAKEKSYIDNSMAELSNRLSIISKFATIVSRDFRGYLLKNYIDFIDSRAKNYANRVFGNKNISFVLDGNNINILFNGKAYENLSGGERQKIDLIVQLSIRDMLCTNLGFSCNILAVDELFDNLDAVGCKNVVDLITTDLNDISSVFIITHHSADISIPCDREIVVTKGDDGISEVVVR